MMDEDGRAALVLVDVINGFAFEGSAGLLAQAEAAAPHIVELTRRARADGVPVIYVNDNFGMWQSDFRSVAESCLKDDQPGRHVVERFLPEPSDYFVLKPRHSGFLATPLEQLLDHLKVSTIVLTGFATDLCVLFTALDAHARGFALVVPSDCTGANDASSRQRAIDLLTHSLGVPTYEGEQVRWNELAGKRRKSLF